MELPGLKSEVNLFLEGQQGATVLLHLTLWLCKHFPDQFMASVAPFESVCR